MYHLDENNTLIDYSCYVVWIILDYSRTRNALEVCE